MGRRKLEIKLIEAKSARQVTFSKRKNGLLKKARELSILCDLDIGVMINSSRGKLYHYCSNTSLTEIVQRYHSHVESESKPSAGAGEAQAESSKYSGFLTCGDLLQNVERDLEEPCVDQLSVTDLLQMENQLQTALIQTRATKTHLLLNSISSLNDEEKVLVEEKRHLEAKIAGGKMDKPLIDLNVVPDGETVG